MAMLVDTGVLPRAFVNSDPECASIRAAIQILMRRKELLYTTFQNVAEFCNVSTRTASARGGYGLTIKIVDARIAFIERLCLRVSENDDSYRIWRQLISKYQVNGVAVHDARLVAIMLAHNIQNVLTLNDRDFQRYASEGISVVSPRSIVAEAQ